MQIQFQKNKCNWATVDLRVVVRYSLEAAFKYLPFFDYLQEEQLEATLDFTFIGAKAMHELNAQMRGVDRVTDILSFPMLDMEDGQLRESLTVADVHPIERTVHLGDLVLCLDRAEEQALDYGHSLCREVAFLTIHGLLHLLGYDHERSVQNQEEMEDLQQYLLCALGITREMTQEQAMQHIHVNLKRLNEIAKNYAIHRLWTEEMAEHFAAEDEMLEDEESSLDVSAEAGYGEHMKTVDQLRSGFVTIIGRPNAGKSTLLNMITGQRIAIVSRKAQTTRNNIRAIYNDENTQIVFVDTPGLHRPDTKLGHFMQDSAQKALRDADVVLMMVDATKARPTEMEQMILETAQNKQLPIIICLNKTDITDKKALLPTIAKYETLAPGHVILPICARTGEGVGELLKLLRRFIPYGPRYYPDDSFTDQSERQIAAEMIREQVLTYTHEEVPHGVAVQIDSFEEIAKVDGDDEYDRSLVRIHASIICDKDSHKGIIIGKKGQSLKRIGSSARLQIERMLACKVYLELHVKVRPDWRNRKGLLNDLGYQNKD